MGNESHLLRLYLGVFQPSSVVSDQFISVKEGGNRFENKICRVIFCRPPSIFTFKKNFNLFSLIFSSLFRVLFFTVKKIQLIFLHFLSFVSSVPFSPLVELTLTSGLRKSGSGGARSCRDSLQMPPMRAPLSPRWLKPIKFNGRYLTRIFGS